MGWLVPLIFLQQLVWHLIPTKVDVLLNKKKKKKLLYRGKEEIHGEIKSWLFIDWSGTIQGGARGVMVIVVGNGHCDTS